MKVKEIRVSKGGQGWSEQHRGLHTKALMWDLGTRHRVFVRTRKTLWKYINSCPAGLEPATLRPIAHDFPTVPLPHHGKSYTDVYTIIIIICRHGLSLLKLE